MGEEYDRDRVEKVRPLAMVCGDWHTGYTDKKVRKATLEMIEEYRPETIILHDFFDGHSVSPFMYKELIYQMIKEGVDKDNLSLERELYLCGKELYKIAERSPDSKIYVVESNHLEFLDRYLDEGRFVKDPINARIAFIMAYYYSKGEYPVKYGIKEVYGSIPDNVVFLSRWDDLKINGYQLGNHGDKSSFDGRGSINTKERYFGQSITGHVHSSEKMRKTYTVGTMLPFDMFYLKGGPIAWTHSHAFLYRTGVQMVNIIDGEWQTS
ncbi:MAG: hypothetical protein N3D75_03335 [Candidatus Aenigmarchaeota archaeon]|nr:hypothetical protein [Candidatus Aenigmarchaeota archaeon]